MLNLAASQGSDPGLALATVLILGFTAVAAMAAVFAAFKTAAATRDAAEIARISALLTTVPLLVPWITSETGGIQVVNRGVSTSHNLRWSVMIGENEIASGGDLKVVRPVDEIKLGRDLQLDPGERSEIHRWAKKRPETLTVVCRYLASWGQEFITTRTYPVGGTDSEIRITDKHDNELNLEQDAKERRWWSRRRVES